MPSKLVNEYLEIDGGRTFLVVKGRAYDVKVLLDTKVIPWVIQHTWYYNAKTEQFSTRIDGRTVMLHHFIVMKWYKIIAPSQVRWMNHPLDLRLSEIWFRNKRLVELEREAELEKLRLEQEAERK
jgi:hypothetical protein